MDDIDDYEKQEVYICKDQEFKIGQEVFFIRHYVSCDATLNKNYGKSRVRALRYYACEDELQRLCLFCSGYSLQNVVFAWHDQTDYIEPFRIYATEEEAKRKSKFVQIDLPADVYMNAIGSRDSGNGEKHTLSEFYRHELEKYVRKDRISQEFCDFYVPHDESELGVCCANLADVRTLIMKAAYLKGLIQYDIDRIVSLMDGCHDEIISNISEMPNVKKIFDGLGITGSGVDDETG